MEECWAEFEGERPPSADLVRRLRLLYYAEFGTEWRLSNGGSGALGDGGAAPPFAPGAGLAGVQRRDSF